MIRYACRRYCRRIRERFLRSGVLFLVTFLVIRAVSFHHFDSFLKVKLAGVKMNWALELGGIFLIGLAAARERPGKLKAR